MPSHPENVHHDHAHPLSNYWKKRNFQSTSEPAGDSKSTARSARAKARPLRFVIQEHHASRLHYDLRLEVDGVFRSWAVPKNLSEVEGEKRLAVEVEDHPLEYGSFEGTIPKGEYGAGTVSIWDEGIFEPQEDPNEGLSKGIFHFELRGKKLHGRWILVRTHGAKNSKQTQWLAMKKPDREMTSMSKAKGALNSKQKPSFEHQLATAAERLPKGSYIFETKMDGYRAFAIKEKSAVRFVSRLGNEWDGLDELKKEFGLLPGSSAVIDGELVVFDANGKSDFQLLQNAWSDSQDSIRFVAFDILEWDGHLVHGLPISERKELLKAVLEKASVAVAKPASRNKKGTERRIQYLNHQTENGEQFLAEARAQGLEGIVAKRADQPYRAGRNADWLKLKFTQSGDFVVVGYTDPGGSNPSFGALLLAVKGDRGELHYSGKVGTGFREAARNDLLDQMSKLEVSAKPFFVNENEIEGTRRKGIHWLDPKLIVEVEYAERTREGILRHARFRGLRLDKTKADAPPKSKKTGGVVVTHRERVVFPREAVTKGEVFDYYEEVCDRMWPYLKDRPLSFLRCPAGIAGTCFFQKHTSLSSKTMARSWGQDLRTESVGSGGSKETVVVLRSKKGLLQAAQWNVLEFHVWGSRVDEIERPDQLIFDLDPGEDVEWEDVVRGAETLREQFAELGSQTFVKWTGGKGLHVVVPIKPEFEWDVLKQFARSVAEQMSKNEPTRYVATMSKQKRSGKILIDHFRNGRGSTAVAPFSVRAREGAPIAVPLSWSEVPRKKVPQFTLRSPNWQNLGREWDDFEKARISLKSLLNPASPQRRTDLHRKSG